jgi:hypothetical protein
MFDPTTAFAQPDHSKLDLCAGNLCLCLTLKVAAPNEFTAKPSGAGPLPFRCRRRFVLIQPDDEEPLVAGPGMVAPIWSSNVGFAVVAGHAGR